MSTTWLVKIPAGLWMSGVHRFTTKREARYFARRWAVAAGPEIQAPKPFRDDPLAKREALYAEARRIVAGGTCPTCGAALRRNLSLRGWWQCEQFGAEGFRKDAARPSCNFQTFTE